MRSQLQVLNLFKKSIILFWTLWWLIALWTDIVGALAHLHFLHRSWALDTNYPFLVESLKIYSLPHAIPTLFFIGIILWSLASAMAFVWASLGLVREEALWLQRAEIAFALSLTYWFAFFIADQWVMKFDLEENHMVQGGFEFLTFLSLYIFPNPTRREQG